MLGEERTQVNEFEAENVRRFQGPNGESFHMFAKSTFTALKSTGELSRITKSQIDLDSLVYNADLPDSEFNLPLVGIIEYQDLDNSKNNFRVHEGNNSWNTRIEEEEPAYAMIGSRAPDFTLDKLDSGRVTLSQVKEKVIVLDFWSTWCRPCITGIHELERVHKWARGNKKSVAFYCININKAPSVVAKFWKAKGFSLPVLLDKDLAVAKSYKTVGIPHMVIISDGTIRHVHIGGATGPEMLKIQQDQLKNEIATLLSE